MKKKIIFWASGILAVILLTFFLDGTQTMADLCGVEKDTEVTGISIEMPGTAPYYGVRTGFTPENPGEYAYLLNKLFHERVLAAKTEEPLSMNDRYTATAELAFHFEHRRSIVLLVPPPEADGSQPEYALLLTCATEPQEIYRVRIEPWMTVDALNDVDRLWD